MDIQRLRQILNELNPIFWNPEIDRQLEVSDYPNQSPIESAKYRHTIALRKLVPRSHHYRKSLEKKRFNKLLKKVKECLSPYDKVFEVLLEEFTSPFAKQVLLTHQNLIEEFAGITSDNYQSWTELLVCMSHKDFWADIASEKPSEAEQNATPAKRQRTKRIIGWIFKKTWRLIGAIIVGLIVAILVIIFSDFGWLEQIKAFIDEILWPK